jgi:hypothetical protein
VLTRDNLSKRRHVEDPSCLFCSNVESAHHLLFECCVAKVMWRNLSDIWGNVIGGDFESLASLWLCSKKFKTLNICTSVVLWAMWKMRNLLCFQVNQWCGMQVVFYRCKMRNFLCFQVNQWCGMQVVLYRCAKILRRWRIMQKEDVASQLEPTLSPHPLCQDARTRAPDEDYFATADCVGGGGCNLISESFSGFVAVRASDGMVGSVGTLVSELVAGPVRSESGRLVTDQNAEPDVSY